MITLALLRVVPLVLLRVVPLVLLRVVPLVLLRVVPLILLRMIPPVLLLTLQRRSNSAITQMRKKCMRRLLHISSLKVDLKTLILDPVKDDAKEEKDAKGGTATVRKGRYRDQRSAWYRWKVAVKRIMVSDKGDPKAAIRRAFKLLLREVEFMRACDNPHVMKVYGFYTDYTKHFLVVLPWMPLNMRAFLEQQPELSLPERISLIRDVAEGVHHLHYRDRPICHHDLKSLNVMITSSKRAVITDFGASYWQTTGSYPHWWRSQLQPSPSPYTATWSPEDSIITVKSPVRTIRWTAPEILNDDRSGSLLPSDIWSLAWVTYEALTGEFPLQHRRTDTQAICTIVSGHLHFIKEEVESQMLQRLLDLMTLCWNDEKERRPSARHFMDLADKLKPMIPQFNRSDPEIFMREAELWVDEGRYDKAEKNYQKAFDTAQNPERKANILHRVGAVYATRGMWKEALNSHEQAETLCSASELKARAAYALLAQASVHVAQNNIPEAVSKHKKALGLFEQDGSDKHGLGHAYYGLGNLRSLEADSLSNEARKGAHGNARRAAFEKARKEALEKAHKTYKRALDVFNDLQDWRMVVSCNLGLGKLCIADAWGNTGNKIEVLDEALGCFRSAFTTSSMVNVDSPQDTARALKGLGHIAYAQGDDVEARNHWERALAIFTSLKDQKECDKLSDRIARLTK
ncbi:hypothetical protein FRB90_001161 [Tulasnella sp. 427]|nr:hypothetical protein FRB90_001161 [Tulasnella sp. 427]